MNTTIRYIYNDRNGITHSNKFIIKGKLEPKQLDKIIKSTCNGQFLPEAVGMDCCRSKDFNPETDAPYCVMDPVTCKPIYTMQDPDDEKIDTDELVRRFENASRIGWHKFAKCIQAKTPFTVSNCVILDQDIITAILTEMLEPDKHDVLGVMDETLRSDLVKAILGRDQLIARSLYNVYGDIRYDHDGAASMHVVSANILYIAPRDIPKLLNRFASLTETRIDSSPVTITGRCESMR